jgi:RNA polymerase sigma factor (sigma-70 family)
MFSNRLGLLRAALGPADPPDADLLGRYVAGRDEAAFAGIVRRHGPMVHAVCRRRLGRSPDADDAFQVTFMVLARDAGRVRESLPGWLYRVAYLVALKQAGKAARRPADPLLDHDAAAPMPSAADEAAGAELRRAVEEELAELPDKLRSVVVLCGLEGRTNAEAAAELGCPTGTVDSRLSAARQKLRTRLARRGWPAAVAGLDALLRDAPAHAGLTILTTRTAEAAVAYAAGRAAADPLTPTADGVTPTMGTSKLKLLAATGLSLAVLGTAGLGLLPAPAGDDPPKAKPPEAKAEEPKKPEAGKLEAGGRPELKAEADVRAALARPFPHADLDGMEFGALLEQLHATFGINARLDTASFKRFTSTGDGAEDGTWVPITPEGQPLHALYDKKIHLRRTRGMTAADLLTEAVAQLPGRLGYRVKGNQVLIGPAYLPPVTPGAGPNTEPGNVTPRVSTGAITEQVAGEPVSLSVEDKPLAEVLKELRTLTGANVVLDARAKDKGKERVSATFDDVRLFTALTIVADMAGLKPAYTGNVYYVTTPENADRMQKAFFKDLYGEYPQQPAPVGVPPGFVTDGYQFFPRTAEMKPVDPTLVFGAGLGGVGGNLPQPVPAPKPVPPAEKK